MGRAISLGRRRLSAAAAVLRCKGLDANLIELVLGRIVCAWVPRGPVLFVYLVSAPCNPHDRRVIAKRNAPHQRPPSYIVEYKHIFARSLFGNAPAVKRPLSPSGCEWRPSLLATTRRITTEGFVYVDNLTMSFAMPLFFDQ